MIIFVTRTPFVAQYRYLKRSLNRKVRRSVIVLIVEKEEKSKRKLKKNLYQHTSRLPIRILILKLQK